LTARFYPWSSPIAAPSVTTPTDVLRHRGRCRIYKSAPERATSASRRNAILVFGTARHDP
jgi:hypothetical protein